MTRTRLRRTVALTAAAVLATGAVACGGDADLPPPPSPGGPGNPVSTLDPEHQEIIDVYYGSVDAALAAEEAGDPNHPDLTRYFLENAQAHLNTQNTIQRHEANGAHYTGEIVVVSAEVTEIDMDAEPPAATVESCLDDTNHRLAYREDGSPVPGTQPGGRYKATVVAVLGTDGHWYVATSTSHWDQSC